MGGKPILEILAGFSVRFRQMHAPGGRLGKAARGIGLESGAHSSPSPKRSERCITAFITCFSTVLGEIP